MIIKPFYISFSIANPKAFSAYLPFELRNSFCSKITLPEDHENVSFICVNQTKLVWFTVTMFEIPHTQALLWYSLLVISQTI